MTANQGDLSFLTEHQSIPARELTAPAPTENDLERILQAAMSAPDHGELQPFRFMIIEGDARDELSRVFEQAAISRGLDQEGITKQKNKPLRAPMIIVVIASLSDNPKIPEIEQLLSAGCAAQHVQLACRILGYGSVWLTGDNAYDLDVYEALDLDFNERIIGFIYVGTPASSIIRKERQDATQVTSRWQKITQKNFAI